MQENILQTPLNHRAWVMQKRYYLAGYSISEAPAVLEMSFTYSMRNEFEGLPMAAHPDAFPLSKFGDDFQRMVFETGNLEDAWFTEIERYTSCGITGHSDKLLALSGITQELAVRYLVADDDAYIAGLWHSLFIPSLLWRVLDGKQGDGSPSKRPTVTETNGYVAPSWSWASVRGKITHNFRFQFVYAHCNNHSSPIDVLETHALPTNQDNPCSQIQDANTRLRGTLISSRRF